MTGLLALPVILIMLMVISVYSLIGGGMDVTISGGYDEEAFQDFANQQYQAEFGSSSAYEDNLLIVFLTSEDHYDFAYIAWVGDHIVKDVNHKLGADGTSLGEAMNACINASNYKYSLDTDLAFVVEELTETIQYLGMEDPFTCEEDHIHVTSHLTNRTDLEMNEDVVNSALAEFTQVTGIPAVIVVEEMIDVFGETTTVGPTFSKSIYVTIAVVAVIVIVIIFLSKRRKQDQDDFGAPTKDSRYRQFDDQY